MRTVATRRDNLRDTTTTPGLTVTARVLEGIDQTGTQIADTVMKTLDVTHHAVCPPWHSPMRPRGEEGLTT